MTEKEQEEMAAVIASLGLSQTMAEMVKTVYHIAFNNGRLRENNDRIRILQERINANQ